MTLEHFVLTRSAYGAAWDLEANRRRLRLFEGVTCRTMAAQTERRVTWILLLDVRDPFAGHRVLAAESTGIPVRILWWDQAGVELAPAPWDPQPNTPRQLVAATAYRAPWNDAIGIRTSRTLLTRIDDDDGFARNALERIRTSAERWPAPGRAARILPRGIRVWQGRQVPVRHPTNAWATLETPAGDELTVYDYGHRQVREQGFPVVDVDEDPGWLWVRHPDSISGIRHADEPISDATRELFPIDWDLVA
ncbi:MAG TPA: glycosyltransferase [Candidatus Limnocylindrales bacterium]|nr:glycosyltransferase [Candidatus Limnocylindrales bacterium]